MNVVAQFHWPGQGILKLSNFFIDFKKFQNFRSGFYVLKKNLIVPPGASGNRPLAPGGTVKFFYESTGGGGACVVRVEMCRVCFP